LDLTREIELATGWMAEADALLRPYIGDEARRRDASSMKAPGQVVTEADHAISELLIERIDAAFGRDAICSEEGGDRDDRSAMRRWIIDPIDGTRSFIRGMTGYTIMLALAIEGEAVLGVVHDPVERATWWAARGRGVYMDGARITPGNQPARLIWSPFAPPGGRETIADALGVAGIVDIESFGARAIVMARDGAGVCASRPHSPHIWDSAAGVVIIEEAGGTVTDYLGAPLTYAGDTLHEQGFVATLGVDHTKARELMQVHLPRS
jgi:fructose-1,6-bisphosphatase/inositol monophosphatase family enzyme